MKGAKSSKMTSGIGERKKGSIKLNAGKLPKLTQKSVVSFLATVKRETQNYQYSVKGNRKGLPLQDNFLIYFPATSLPPIITAVLR